MKQKYTIMIADVQMNIVTDETPETVEAIVGILDRRIREIYLQSGNRCPKNEAALLCALDYCAERNRLQDTVNKLEEEKKNNDTEALRAEVARLAEECDGVRAQLAVSEEKFRNANADAGIAGEQVRILTQKAVAAETGMSEAAARAKELEKKLADADAAYKALAAELEALKSTPVAAPAAEPVAEAVAAPVAEPVKEEPVMAEPAPVAEAPAEKPVEKPAEKPAEKAPVSALADNVDGTFEIEMKPLRKPVDENQLTIDSVPADEKPAEPEKNLSDAATMEKEKQKAQKRVRSMFDLITFDNV